MDDKNRNPAVVPLRAHLACIDVVGDLEGNKLSKRRDHFLIVSVDEREIAKSEKTFYTVPVSRWEWPEGYQFRFQPSSTIKIIIYRKSSLRITKHLVGQYIGKVIELLENDSTIDLEDESGARMAPKLKINLSLVPEPEDQDAFENFMKTVDIDISHLDNSVRAPPEILALARALQLTKSILDIVANVDPSPILRTSLAVMSAVYGAINQTSLQDDTIRDLAESLREMLGVAKEYPDLPSIKGTTDVVEEVGRTSLKVASLIYEHTRAPFGRRTLRSQLSDDLTTRIAQCRKSCNDLKEKIDRRVILDMNRAIKETKGDMNENNAKIQNTLKTIKDDERASKIYHWLAAPDSSKNYNEAREKHQKDTCSWFLDGQRFREFQDKGDFLWIKGKAGCGKTILCSTVIDKIKKLCKENPPMTYAYFFFDGRDSQKDLQLHDKLIRSLVLQLSLQCDGIPAPLVDLYGHGYHQPSTDSLEDVLYHIIDGMHSTYIIIDSLDECIEREKSLQWIQQLISRRVDTLHLVVMSRPERDIEDVLELLDMRCVDLVKESTNHDITVYLEQQISVLEKWDEDTRHIVKSTLTDRAEGMFRWVALQLMELKKCSNRRSVMTQLTSLPNGLYETYDRILSKIDNENDRTDITTFLRWLCFSVRPMKLTEVAETITVDFDTENGPQYKPVHRYWDERDVLGKCAGLITESEELQTRTIKLAHFSIKEYLFSEHLRAGSTASFHLASEELCHSVISQTCLAYLMQFDTLLETLDSVRDSVAISSPLAPYAAEHWIFHAHAGGIDKSASSWLLTLANGLFMQKRSTFINWVQIWNLDSPHNTDPRYSPKKFASPLYYASLAGLQQVSLRLSKEVDINARGGNCYTALQAASYLGHETIVKLLLDKGVDVNAQGGFFGTALQAASANGYVAIVKLLLDSGAVDAQGGEYGSAFQAASQKGHVTIAKLLLEKGADINIQGGRNGTALQEATFRGHGAIVKLLLEKKANVNAQGGIWDTALQAASRRGYVAGVKLLLENGADVNVQGGLFGNALQAASSEGHDEVVRLLLENGADVNAQGGEYANALLAASFEGHAAVVQLLLENGADVNTQGDHSDERQILSCWTHQSILEGAMTSNQGQVFGSALQAASFRGHDAIVKLLLEHGADANMQGGGCGNALQAASRGGHEAIVKLLLKKVADVNVQWGPYGNALQAAAASGNDSVVKLLVDKGADVNVQGGFFGNALHAASESGNDTTVKLLLQKGADPNLQGGFFGNALSKASASGNDTIVKLLLTKGANVNVNALQEASHKGHETVVKLLLEHGADVNGEGQYGTALQAASAKGHEAGVKLLLENGADVNTQAGQHGTALQAASGEGHEAVVKLLLENGADVNAQAGLLYDTALQAASAQDHVAVVKLLLEKGANVNAQGGMFGSALQAASSRSNSAVVKLLLEKGADVNMQDGTFGSALQGVSFWGIKALAKLLIENGADVNAQGGEHGNALQMASYQGHDAIVQLLLEKGVDVNVQGGKHGNALQAASSEGHDTIVRLLLENGAHVNAQGGEYGNALHAASRGAHEASVKLLLEKGAEVNAQGGDFGNALQAASFNGHGATVQLLLKKGANVNAQGGKYGNALQAAYRGRDAVVKKLLLDRQANGFQTVGEYGNALRTASPEGYEAVVKMLLEKGADNTVSS